MDRWERRLQVMARASARDDAHHEHGGEVPSGAGSVIARIHPDEARTVRALLDIAAAHPGFVAHVPLLVREGDDWVRHEVEFATEVMGPVVRLLDETAPAPGGAGPANGPDPAIGRPPRVERGRLLDEVRTAMSRAGTDGVGLVLADIDHFKLINDAVGDHEGDAILDLVADRVRTTAGRAFAAWLGEDAYAVVVPHAADLDAAAATGERVRAVIAEPIAVADASLELAATAGVAVATVSPDAEPSVVATAAEQLLSDAETALSTGKASGRDRLQRFDPDLAGRSARRASSSRLVRRALDDDTLDLHFQPVLSLDTGMVIGAEALLRLDDEAEENDPRVVRPSDLIDAAEESGLTERLLRFVLGAALRRLAEWEQALGSGRRFRLSVNISAAQLATPGFAEVVADALATTGVEPARLSLELTESVLVRPSPEVDTTVAALVELGVTFGLDGLGDDETALGALRRFPLDMAKLDRRVVADVDRDPTAEAIAASAIGLVRQLGLTAVAVGVERDHQRDVLRRLGCDAAQGFLFDAPLTAGEFADRL